MTKTILLVAVAAVCGDLLAQSNSRGPGYDGALTSISNSRVWGRRGPAYPGGEVGVSFQNNLCNPGTIPLEWRAPMQPDHPKFSFMVAKLDGDRIVQISDWSYNKHAFLSLNDNACGSCVIPPAGGQQMGINCSDVYGNSNNGDRFYLAPPSELNPWLGTWNPVGSYFDRGDPQVAGAAATDGVRSLTQTQVGAFDAVKNRVTIKEADLVGITSGNMFFQIQVLHEGEPATNRANNFMSRPFSLSYSTTTGTWSTSTLGTATQGTVLTRWPGATLTTAGNGNDDGRFTIACKVTGPVNGFWHYEYAVINLDNNRAGAGFHIPVCGSARVQNIGFRDIDQNPLNNWVGSYTGSEVAWLATAGNPHNWNTLYNFWFDSDVGPASGSATIDQANPGPGNLTFPVPTTVPGTQLVLQLGPGCGTPSSTLSANGWPTAGNASFALDVTTDPFTVVLWTFSGPAAVTSVAPGCDAYVDVLNLIIAAATVTDAAGLTSLPIAIPPGQLPAEIWFQGAPLIPSPPVLGVVGLTNGLKIRFAGSGCN